MFVCLPFLGGNHGREFIEPLLIHFVKPHNLWFNAMSYPTSNFYSEYIEVKPFIFNEID